MTAALSINSLVVIQDNPQEPSIAILQQWLQGHGREVRLLASADEAIDFAADLSSDSSGDGSAELLVLTLADPSEQAAAIDRIGRLPAGRRPKNVALLADEEPDATLRRRLPGVKLHLLGQPIHTLGLLDIAKRITA